MIQVDDVLDATPVIKQNITKAIHLIEVVRKSGHQADVLKFVEYMRAIAREVDEAMVVAIAMLNRVGTLDDVVFARVCSAGHLHTIMTNLCDLFATDPSNTVRLACASGTIVLGMITISANHVKVIKIIQKRLNEAV